MNKPKGKRPRINPLVFMGLIGMFTIGTNFAGQLYRAFGGNQDIWWTPRTMQLPIENSKNNFELFISGKSLQKHLADESLFALDNNGEQYRVVSKDLTIRLNNWNKVKSSILTNAIISGVAFGIVITVLVIGLIQVFGQKKKFC
ncbi:MAG: hypothetical protein KAW92_11425 [Candidatus Cloacimonetes bacterium]|nr:hypothetical protein [Candidatus Cloacimonadota bacterium]